MSWSASASNGPTFGLVHNFDHDLGYNPVRLGEIVQAIGATETVADAYQRVFTPLFPSYRSTMANLLGLRYIAIDRPVEMLDKKLRPGDLKLVARTSGAYIYENPRALPRVIFASGWVPADFDRLVADGRWPNFDPLETVLLNGTPPKTPAFQGVHVSLSRPGIWLTSYKNTEVQIDVDSPRAGFVVLNDVWHPWWFGTVDGKPADILRANVLFRAIQVPAGKHTVRFEFKPVEGAMKEVAARIQGKPLLQPGPEMPANIAKPEASAPDLMQIAGRTAGTVR